MDARVRMLDDEVEVPRRSVGEGDEALAREGRRLVAGFAEDSGQRRQGRAVPAIERGVSVPARVVLILLFLAWFSPIRRGIS